MKAGFRAPLGIALALALTSVSSVPARAQAGAPAPEKTIVRISFFSAQPDVMRKFYQEALDFVPAWDALIGEGPNAKLIADAWHLPAGAQLRGALLRAPRGDMEIQISYMTGGKLPTRPQNRKGPPFSGQAYMVFHVPDLDATVAKLKPFNIQYNRPPMKMTAIDAQGRSFPVYEAVIYDPDGTPIILVQDPASLNPYAAKPTK